MSRDHLAAPVVFDSQALAFGAYDPGTRRLVLVVEANSEFEALARVDVVAPMLGYKGVWQLVVQQLDEMPTGIATFLSAFFVAMEVGGSRAAVAPGSSTVQ
jgi:hypothetical protein